MTTAVKPLPAHGTYARANGCPGYREPCKCQPCLDTRHAKKKRERVNRELGRLAHTDATAARRKLQQLNKTMGWEAMARTAGTSASHLREIANGRIPRVKNTTHNKILAMRAVPSGGQYIDATGSIRRVRALQAIGHTASVIAEAADSHRSRILPLINGHPRLRRLLAERIERAYQKLSQQPGDNKRSSNRAMREKWAPPGAWDDDTIDDPAAVPDVTGHCGTDRGYWMHSLQQLPMCPRCEAAHADWLADNAHLPVQELNQARFRARNAAASRETDLAHDARELLRVSGLDTQQAAERLGVTRNHLQQVLLRHPELEGIAA